MSLLRILGALIAGGSFHIAATPPNPPSDRDERSASHILEMLVPIRLAAVFLKAVCWAAVIAESAVIISSKDPSSPLSRRIHSAFFMDGNPDDLRFTPTFVVGTLLTAAGALTRWWCYRALGKNFTFEMIVREDHKLVTSGPYAVVRHPSYTGVVLVVVGLFCLHATPGSWLQESGALRTVIGKTLAWSFLALVSSMVIGALTRMSIEDEAMNRKFGQKWREWAEIVPHKLVPGVY